MNNQLISQNVWTILSGIGYRNPIVDMATLSNRKDDLIKCCIQSTIFDLALKSEARRVDSCTETSPRVLLPHLIKFRSGLQSEHIKSHLQVLSRLIHSF